jgi:hypothetical protein
MPKVNNEYPGKGPNVSDDQLKKMATEQYQNTSVHENSYDFPTEIVELPSQGRFYPDGHPLKEGKIEMKYMTAKEEDILTNQSYIKSGVVIDRLLKALIVTPIEYNDLLLGDKNAIMIAARVLGYGKEYEASITDEEGNKQKVKFDLTQLEDKEIDWSHYDKKDPFVFELPTSKRKVEICLLTQGKQRKMDAELKGLQKIKKGSAELTTRWKHTIISVDGETDDMKKRKFVDNELLAIDSRALRKFVNSITPDVDLTIEAVSEETGEPFRSKFPIGVDFFWPDAKV